MLSGLKLSSVCSMQQPFEYVPTGCQSLDRFLGGGIRTSALTEVFGASGSGKTQFGIELMLNTIFSPVKGNVIYVSTKNCLTPDDIKRRIRRYVDNLPGEEKSDSKEEPLTLESVLKKISHKRVFHLKELIYIVYHVREIVESAYYHNKIKLVVIDSFTHFLRDQDPIERIRISFELAEVLISTAVKFNCAVLITTDMSANFKKNKPFKTLKPLIGRTFAIRPNQRIELQRNPSNNVTTAIIRKNLEGCWGVANYQVDEERGIIDV